MFFGLLTICIASYAACDTTEVSVDTSNNETLQTNQAKAKAGKILDKLQSNIHRDLPAKVNQTEETITEI